jgi:hypothetical protein
MSWTKIFFVILIIFNIFVVIYDLPAQGSKTIYASSLFLFALTLPMLLYAINKYCKVLAWNAALISLFLLIINGVFFFKVIEYQSIRVWTALDKGNFAAVEFLDESPFVKFKGNTLITSQGYRGEDFTYNWTTDDFGFKNLNSLLEEASVDFIALGDSFTEGMGNSISNTWPSKVQKLNSFKIYNAGVQGYAATQMQGAYDLLKTKVTHDGIIIGALPTIYTREQKFVLDDLSIAQQGVGGIASIIATNKKPSFLVGFLRYIIVNVLPRDVSDNKANKYKIVMPDKLKNDSNWKRYVFALTKLSEEVLSEGKRVVLIQFPVRSEVYFDAEELGLSDIHQTRYYVELEALKSAMPSGVEILDMFPFIKSKYKKNERNIYFEIDGHMNEYGSQLVAEFLSSNL